MAYGVIVRWSGCITKDGTGADIRICFQLEITLLMEHVQEN